MKLAQRVNKAIADELRAYIAEGETEAEIADRGREAAEYAVSLVTLLNLGTEVIEEEIEKRAREN